MSEGTKQYEKPLPEPRPETQIYWDACKRHELTLPKCRSCDRFFFYPRAVCPHCMSQDIEWVKSSGRGKVWTFSAHHLGPTKAYVGEPPHVVAIVDMDEGCKMMSNIVGCSPEDVSIGMEVKVVFDDVTDEITLPKFKPIAK